MNEYEKLKNVWKELNQLEEKKEDYKSKYYDNKLSYTKYNELYQAMNTKREFLTIKENIIKNNLLVLCHEKLMKIYKEIYKKYESKNIGEKRKEEIEETFRKEIEDIFNYTDEAYFNRFYLFFNCNYEKETKIFNIRIEKLKYDFSFYLEDEEIKNRYLITIPEYVENVEEEATRLQNLYNDTLKKKEEMQKQLDELRENLNKNFIKNLYNDTISNTFRHLYL